MRATQSHRCCVCIHIFHLQFVVLMRLFAIELLFRLARFHRVDFVGCCLEFGWVAFVALEWSISLPHSSMPPIRIVIVSLSVDTRFPCKIAKKKIEQKIHNKHTHKFEMAITWAKSTTDKYIWETIQNWEKKTQQQQYSLRREQPNKNNNNFRVWSTLVCIPITML